MQINHKFKFIRLVLALPLMTIMSLSVTAQDGNGIYNPDSYASDTSNWCDENSVWGPELCNNGQLAPPDWMYAAGWYFQRVTEGDITLNQVPEQYRRTTEIDSSDNGDGTATITMNTPTGPRTITIVLLGASGTDRHPNAPATADHELNQDNFDAPSESPSLGINANDNLVIYGNSANNTITGGDGNDIIHGGDESCTGDNCNAGGILGDTLNGGAGDDTINGGNESCTGTSCNYANTTTGATHIGDTINGGDGNDVINGGNETCNGNRCNRAFIEDSTMGDVINGGDGDDMINGGDESCSGVDCNSANRNNVQANIGDTINGGDGSDIINGGDESCSGNRCNRETNAQANIGDTINQNDTGNTDDGDVDTIDGGSESAAAGNGDTTDTCQTSTGDTATNC